MPDITFTQRALAAWGYDLEITGELDVTTHFVWAFQVSFRARDYRGELDAETVAIALALAGLSTDAYAALMADTAPQYMRLDWLFEQSRRQLPLLLLFVLTAFAGAALTWPGDSITLAALPTGRPSAR